MEQIEIKRNNCNHGPWELPDETASGGTKWVSFYEMARYYIGEKGYDLDRLKNWNFLFTPDNPEDEGAHNVPGTVIFEFEP